MLRDFFIGRQGKAADFAFEGKQWVKRTSCWRELAQSHLIQHKPSAAYSQGKKKKNLAWPSLTPHTKPERPWRQWINCSPLSLIHHILNRNELQAQNGRSRDYKKAKKGILFNFVQTVNKNKHWDSFFYFFLGGGAQWVNPKRKQQMGSSGGCVYTGFDRLTRTQVQEHRYLDDFSKQHQHEAAGNRGKLPLGSPSAPTSQVSGKWLMKNTIPSHLLALKSFREWRRYSLCLPWLLSLQTHTVGAT